MKDKIIEMIDKAIGMLDTIRIDLALKPTRKGIDDQASDLNILLCQIHDRLTEQPEEVSDIDICNKCGRRTPPCKVLKEILKFRCICGNEWEANYLPFPKSHPQPISEGEIKRVFEKYISFDNGPIYTLSDELE